jgi:methionine-rich copper-binding protein CopC
MKRFITFLASSLLLLLGFAFAHSDLESSSPADGSVLAAAPIQIVLNFAEEAQIEFSIFKVYPLPLSPEAMAMMDAEPVTEEMMASEDTASAGNSAESDVAEDEHTEGEEHTDSATKDTSATEDADTDGKHTDEVMDTAAKELIPMVLEVTDDKAARVDTGIVEKDTSKTVTLNVKENLAPGAYVVMWRVLSVDTHTVEGSLTFFVK